MIQFHSLAVVLLDVTFLLYMVPTDCCACSLELQEEVYNLKVKIQFLEKQLYRNCQKCPANYYVLGEKCYNPHMDRKPWTEAALNCSQEGAQLVSFQTQEEETLVREFLATLFDLPYKSRFYTAGNELEQKGVWKWGTGDEGEVFGDYTNWAPGEPNDHQGEPEKCVEFHQDEGWNDVPCYLDFMWICETVPRIPWMDGHMVGTSNGQMNGMNGGQQYKPFWVQAKYNRGSQGNTEDIDGQTEQETEENTDEQIVEQSAGGTDETNTEEDNDGDTEGTNEGNTDNSFMVTMEA